MFAQSLEDEKKLLEWNREFNNIQTSSPGLFKIKPNLRFNSIPSHQSVEEDDPEYEFASCMEEIEEKDIPVGYYCEKLDKNSLRKNLLRDFIVNN